MIAEYIHSQDRIAGAHQYSIGFRSPPNFSPEQFSQLLKLINKENTLESSANMASTSSTNAANDRGTSTMACSIITTLLANAKNKKWIVDTGATSYMSSNLELLSEAMEFVENRKVNLPNVEVSDVSHTRSCGIFKGEIIKEVLYVPDFKYNLLSVSKITKELNCLVAFYPTFCLFQDLFNGRVLGIGKKEDGLYLLYSQVNIEDKHPAIRGFAVGKHKESLRIWHKRMEACISSGYEAVIQFLS